jgi:hypothetical protein
MFNSTEILIEQFIEKLDNTYRRVYGAHKIDYLEIIEWVASMILENIATGDALYHNTEHTIYVTLVGQEILRGKHIREGGVSCEDWLNFTISLLCHDIGYIKGVCRDDAIEKRTYATGVDKETITLPRGASDASLTPYHVDRGKLFVKERFAKDKLLDMSIRFKPEEGIDVEIIKENIELTRFPIPSDDDHQGRRSYPGLLRAADLIGQLSDPRYMQKITALFYEFEETGTNKKLGYKSPADLRDVYPKFYWNTVNPYVVWALRFLDVTQEGRQVVANLYSNVFRVEHDKLPFGETF